MYASIYFDQFIYRTFIETDVKKPIIDMLFFFLFAS